MKITWSPKALQSYFSIFNSINERRSKKEVEKFVEQTDKVIEQITDNPNMFIATDKRKDVRKGFVNKLVSLYYKVYPRKKEIVILRFWDNRQDPKKLKY